MIKMLKKLARTAMTYFPFIKDGSYLGKRYARKLFRISFEKDFDAVSMFPDREDLLCVDVGGNQGAAIDAILMKHGSCGIDSFEPNPRVCQKTLSRFKNNSRVRVFNFGLGQAEGEFTLHIPVYRGYVFDGLASLDENFDDGYLANSMFFYNKKHLTIQNVVCKLKRLDDMSLAPFFIKIDVEGFELEVLLGGERTIERSRPIILMESVRSDSEVLRFLERFGYKMFRYDRGKFYEGESGSPNSFLMTADKLELLTR